MSWSAGNLDFPNLAAGQYRAPAYFTAIYAALRERLEACGLWASASADLPDGSMDGKFRSFRERAYYEHWRDQAIPYFLDVTGGAPTATHTTAPSAWTLASMATEVGTFIYEGLESQGQNPLATLRKRGTTAAWMLQQYEILRRMTWTAPGITVSDKKYKAGDPWPASWTVNWHTYDSLHAAVAYTSHHGVSAIPRRNIYDASVTIPLAAAGSRTVYLFLKTGQNSNPNPALNTTYFDDHGYGYTEDDYNLYTSEALTVADSENHAFDDVLAGGAPTGTILNPYDTVLTHYGFRVDDHACYVNYAVANGFEYQGS